MNKFPVRSIALGAAMLLGAAFSQAALAASLTFNNAANPDEVRISAGQFESGFFVNGALVQSPGLGTGATTVLETENACVINYTGTWIDLGQATLGTRTIYFVDPADNAVVTDILVVTVSRASGSSATIAGTWTSSVCGGLGAVPGATPPEDIVLADGTLVGFSNSFLGARASASPSPALGTARFNVTKTFSDGNDAEVDVTLTCNSGLPLEQTFTIAGGDADGVTFIVTDIPGTGADCAVTETGGPGGYTTDLSGCEWEGVLGGLRACAITNTANDATYTVVKDWVQEGTGGDIINAVADVTIKCNSQIDNLGQAKDGYWYKSASLGDGGMLQASVDVSQGPATCSASEEILQSGVESMAEGCGEVRLGPGASQTCTFTNTVFFEGIPTLSQYGLALLALLMLGVGFIGMRRFV